MSQVTKFIVEEVVKETYLVYISVRMGEESEFQETEIKVKKRDPKKHKKTDKFLRFPFLARRFYYQSVYVTKLKVGKKTIKLKSDKLDKSKEYEVVRVYL